MNYLKRFWNWLLGKTTVDEKVMAAVEEAKKDVAELRERAQRVAKEAKEVGAAVKKVVEESKDVVEAVRPAKRKSRKPRAKKYVAKK